jgi:hypothetical protein
MHSKRKLKLYFSTNVWYTVVLIRWKTYITMLTVYVYQIFLLLSSMTYLNALPVLKLLSPSLLLERSPSEIQSLAPTKVYTVILHSLARSPETRMVRLSNLAELMWKASMEKHLGFWSQMHSPVCYMGTSVSARHPLSSTLKVSYLNIRQTSVTNEW